GIFQLQQAVSLNVQPSLCPQELIDPLSAPRGGSEALELSPFCLEPSEFLCYRLSHRAQRLNELAWYGYLFVVPAHQPLGCRDAEAAEELAGDLSYVLIGLYQHAEKGFGCTIRDRSQRGPCGIALDVAMPNCAEQPTQLLGIQPG